MGDARRPCRLPRSDCPRQSPRRIVSVHACALKSARATYHGAPMPNDLTNNFSVIVVVQNYERRPESTRPDSTEAVFVHQSRRARVSGAQRGLARKLLRRLGVRQTIDRSGSVPSIALEEADDYEAFSSCQEDRVGARENASMTPAGQERRANLVGTRHRRPSCTAPGRSVPGRR